MVYGGKVSFPENAKVGIPVTLASRAIAVIWMKLLS